jgi:hypothetical protein
MKFITLYDLQRDEWVIINFSHVDMFRKGIKGTNIYFAADKDFMIEVRETVNQIREKLSDY